MSWSKDTPTLSPTTTSAPRCQSADPMVTVPGVRVFEIVPFKVTGHAVEPDLRDEPRDLSTDTPAETESQPSGLRLTPESAHELAATLRSAHWDINSKITDTEDPVARETLLERRRLLEGLAAQLVDTRA